MRRVSIATILLFSTSLFAQEDFSQCVAQLTEKAKTQGIAQSTINQTLAKAQQRKRVINLDRSQPEFLSTFEDYYSKRVNTWRIEKGQTVR